MILFFKHCPVCGDLISSNEFICEECKLNLERARFDSFMQRCKRCYYPLVSNDYYCCHCKEFPNVICYPIFDYSDSFARKMLDRYKFAYRKEFAKLFASEFRKQLNDNDIIVPIPSSKSSKSKRGWDQMLEISRFLKNKTARLIIRNENVSDVQQKKLNRNQRLSSYNKFSFNNLNISRDENLAIIDDVTTTGATISSAYKILENEGYKNIRAVTLFAEL